MYGNHVYKSGLSRISENTPKYSGVVVLSSKDIPLVRNQLLFIFSFLLLGSRYLKLPLQYLVLSCSCIQNLNLMQCCKIAHTYISQDFNEYMQRLDSKNICIPLMYPQQYLLLYSVFRQVDILVVLGREDQEGGDVQFFLKVGHKISSSISSHYTSWQYNDFEMFATFFSDDTVCYPSRHGKEFDFSSKHSVPAQKFQVIALLLWSHIYIISYIKSLYFNENSFTYIKVLLSRSFVFMLSVKIISIFEFSLRDLEWLQKQLQNADMLTPWTSYASTKLTLENILEMKRP